MKIRANRIIITLATAFSAVAILCACDEDFAQVTNPGRQTAESFDDLTKCNEKNEGEIAYVRESGTLYLCAGSVWKMMVASENTDASNGANGKNGMYCSVSALMDNSGYDIICGGEKVGKILNGKDGARGDKGDDGDKGDKGADGAAGSDCTAKALKDGSGFEMSCGGVVVGTIKNGKNGDKGDKGNDCSGKVLKNGSGIELTCGGKVVGTLQNGEDGAEAKTCETFDDGKGSVTIKCGGKVSLTRYKALCGLQPYDPEKKVCLGTFVDPNGNIIHMLMHLCGGIPYYPEKADPEDGALFTFFKQISEGSDQNEVVFSSKPEPTGEGSGQNEGFSTMKSQLTSEMSGQYKMQSCKDGVLYKKCGDEEFNTESHFCDSKKVYEKCGGKKYNPSVFGCDNGTIRKVCNGVYLEENQKCEDGVILTYCGNSAFDATKKFCFDESESDIKDLCGGKTYKTTEFCGKDNQVHSLCGEDSREFDTDNEICKDGQIITLYTCGDYQFERNPDSDGDGFCDPWFSEEGFSTKYNCGCTGVDQCPSKAESKNDYQDDDGCPDEIPEMIKDGILEGVQFVKDGSNKTATLTDDSYTVLDNLANVMKKWPSLTILINSYTDNIGHSENLQLTQDRADVVKQYLVDKGISKTRIEAVGMGDANPVASNKTPESRALNNRIEIFNTTNNAD